MFRISFTSSVFYFLFRAHSWVCKKVHEMQGSPIVRDSCRGKPKKTKGQITVKDLELNIIVIDKQR
jgi:hypothetical protein